MDWSIPILREHFRDELDYHEWREHLKVHRKGANPAPPRTRAAAPAAARTSPRSPRTSASRRGAARARSDDDRAQPSAARHQQRHDSCSDRAPIARRACIVIAGIDMDVLIDGGRIVGCCCADPAGRHEVVDGGGRYCAPGLIDIHVHGGGGFDLMTDDPEQVARLRALGRAARRHVVPRQHVRPRSRRHRAATARARADAVGVRDDGGAARARLPPRRPVHQSGAQGRVPAAVAAPAERRRVRELFEAVRRQRSGR